MLAAGKIDLYFLVRSDENWLFMQRLFDILFTDTEMRGREWKVQVWSQMESM